MPRGRAAERVAADFLHVRGFVVLAHNVRYGPHEVDLVARRGDLLVCVEVRLRRPGALVGPFASLGPKKRRALLRAAERVFHAYRDDASLTRFRLDAIAVEYGEYGVCVRHAEGALTTNDT